MTTPLTSARTLPFSPPSIEGDPPVSFAIRVPTYLDRDELGIRLFQSGVQKPSQQQIRSTMIAELFEVRGPGGEDQAEQDAAFLEGFWQLDQMDAVDLTQYLAQERERMADMIASPGLVIPPPDPFVPRTSIRDRARVTMLTSEITEKSQVVRNLIAQEQKWSTRFDIALVQMHVADVHGLDVTLGFDASGEALTMATIEQLRDQLARQSGTAWGELVRHIHGLYDLPAVERGNSGSPRENISHRNGSPIESGGGAKTGGNSRTRRKTAKARSGSAPTRSAGSRKTTATS